MTPNVYRLAVALVGATLMLSVLGIVYLASTVAGPIPDVLQNIAVGSLTGLVGLLAVPTTRSRV